MSDPALAPIDAATRPSDLDAARARFPAVQNHVYANVGSRGVLSNAARDAAIGMIDGHWLGGSAKADRNRLIDRCRRRFATLVHAAPEEVAVLKNVSEGLNSVATAMDWRAGDNVVLCGELEHPNNIYLWLALRRFGVELRQVPPRDGAIDAPAMAATIDGRTRIVTASSVTFTPGFRTDLKTIGQASRAAGAFFLVDAVQSCGVLDLDVGDACVDGLATSTSKGLLGIMGLGFLYVSTAWLDRLTPAFVSRYSVERGDGHESEIEAFDVRYAGNAKRFEIGNYNWTGIAVADVALGELLAVGLPVIEAHTVGLSRRLADGLTGLGWPVNTPPEEAMRSHLVTVGTLGAGDAYSSHDPRLNRLIAALQAAGIRFAVRRGLLRFGFHLFNTADDVDSILDVARATD